MRLVVFNEKIVGMGVVSAEIGWKSGNLIILVESYPMLMFRVICDIIVGLLLKLLLSYLRFELFESF